LDRRTASSASSGTDGLSVEVVADDPVVPDDPVVADGGLEQATKPATAAKITRMETRARRDDVSVMGASFGSPLIRFFSRSREVLSPASLGNRL
jgi:hypothetical protein